MTKRKKLDLDDPIIQQLTENIKRAHAGVMEALLEEVQHDPAAIPEEFEEDVARYLKDNKKLQ